MPGPTRGPPAEGTRCPGLSKDAAKLIPRAALGHFCGSRRVGLPEKGLHGERSSDTPGYI